MAGVYTHCSQEAPASRPNQQLLRRVFETFAVLLAIRIFTRPQGRLSHAAGLSFSLWQCQCLCCQTVGGRRFAEAQLVGLIGVRAQVPEGKGSADEERRADIHSCCVLKPPHLVPALMCFFLCLFLPLLRQLYQLFRKWHQEQHSNRSLEIHLWIQKSNLKWSSIFILSSGFVTSGRTRSC